MKLLLLPQTLKAFLGRTVLLLVLLTGLWTQVSSWTSTPVAVLAQWALKTSDWVVSVRTQPRLIEVQTQLAVPVRGGHGDILVDADPAHYAYGLPILWALLLAAGGWGCWAKALGGWVLLLPFQAFSLSLDLLKQIALAMPGGTRALGIAQWQMEAIGLGYQLGALVLPTLVPMALWLWLDRAFVIRVVQPHLAANLLLKK